MPPKNTNSDNNPFIPTVQTIKIFRSSILDESELGDAGFCGGRKTREPGEKPSEYQQPKNSNHITWHQANIKPGLCWQEVSTLTTRHSPLGLF